MRSLIRVGAVAAALALPVALAALPVAAGNFAQVTMVQGSEDPPVAGEEREIRFVLLQHGVTPVDHGQVQLTATLPGSDEPITVLATSVGDGEWTARVTLPVEGEWQLQVTHSEFETSAPTALSVAPAGFSAPPAALPVTGIALAGVALALLTVVIGRRRRPMRPDGAAVTPMG
jgi:hypothetical protein